MNSTNQYHHTSLHEIRLRRSMHDYFHAVTILESDSTVKESPILVSWNYSLRTSWSRLMEAKQTTHFLDYSTCIWIFIAKHRSNSFISAAAAVIIVTVTLHPSVMRLHWRHLRLNEVIFCNIR